MLIIYLNFLLYHYLLSVGHVFDEGFQVLFRVDTVIVLGVEKKTIMVGRRVASNRIWMVDVTDINTKYGFNADSILDISCSMVGEDYTQMTVIVDV